MFKQEGDLGTRLIVAAWDENKHGYLGYLSFSMSMTSSESPSDVEGLTYLCFFDDGSWFQVNGGPKRPFQSSLYLAKV